MKTTRARRSQSAHILSARGAPAAETLRRARIVVRRNFGIDHVTLQIEPAGFEEDTKDV
jgi:hypothetical protein